jgi:hypothetical protein
VLPTVWKNFESDLNAPDISEWLPHQISNYFAQNGFGNDVCKVFMEQVCDLYSIKRWLDYIKQEVFAWFNPCFVTHIMHTKCKPKITVRVFFTVFNAFS